MKILVEMYYGVNNGYWGLESEILEGQDCPNPEHYNQSIWNTSPGYEDLFKYMLLKKAYPLTDFSKANDIVFYNILNWRIINER